MSLPSDRIFIEHARGRLRTASSLSGKELDWLLDEVFRRTVSINASLDQHRLRYYSQETAPDAIISPQNALVCDVQQARAHRSQRFRDRSP